jgi:ankyrin repeat protein
MPVRLGRFSPGFDEAPRRPRKGKEPSHKATKPLSPSDFAKFEAERALEGDVVRDALHVDRKPPREEFYEHFDPDDDGLEGGYAAAAVAEFVPDPADDLAAVAVSEDEASAELVPEPAEKAAQGFDPRSLELEPDILALVRKHPRAVTKRIMASFLSGELSLPLTAFLRSHSKSIGSFKFKLADMPGRVGFFKALKGCSPDILHQMGNIFFNIYSYTGPSPLGDKVFDLTQMCFLSELDLVDRAVESAVREFAEGVGLPISYNETRNNKIIKKAIEVDDDRLFFMMMSLTNSTLSSDLGVRISELKPSQKQMFFDAISGSSCQEQSRKIKDAVYYACKENDVSIFNELRLRGVNIKGAFSDTRAALISAVDSGSVDVLRELKTAGFDMNNVLGGKSILCDALESRWLSIEVKTRVVSTLLELGADPVLRSTYRRYRPILMAVSFGDPAFNPIIKDLLEHGASPHETMGGVRDSLLMNAVRAGDEEGMELLLENGATVDHRNRQGQTALTIAVVQKNLKVVRLLLAKGANVNENARIAENILDILNRAPGSFEEKRELLDLLLNSGAKIPVKYCKEKETPRIPGDMRELLIKTQVSRERGLRSAIEDRDLESMRSCLDLVGVKDFFSLEESYPLCAVAEGGWIEGLGLCLELGIGIDGILRKNRPKGIARTALQIVAERGHVDAAEFLISHRAMVGWKHGATALHVAARAGQIPMMRFLFERGALETRLDHTDSGGNALHCAAFGGCVEAVRLLQDIGLEIGSKDKLGNSAMIWAARSGQPEMCMFLEKSGVGVGREHGELGSKLETGLHAVAARKTTVRIVSLREEGVLDRYNRTIDQFLERGIGIDSLDAEGYTPLSLAVRNFDLEMVEAMLLRGANILLIKPPLSEMKAEKPIAKNILKLLTTEQENRRAAFFQAIKDRDMARIEKSFPFMETDAEVDSVSALGCAAIEGWEEGLEFFLAKGIDIEAVDSKGYTAIQKAVLGNKPEIVELLRSRGANIGAVGRRSCLLVALNARNIGMLRFLRGLGADFNEKCGSVRGTLLHYAYTIPGHEELIKFLTEEAGISRAVRDGYGRTVFHWILSRGEVSSVELGRILEDERACAEFDIRATDSEGRSAVHFAAGGKQNLKRRKKYLKLLLGKEFEIDAKDTKGQTALCFAAAIESEGLVRLLLERGANILAMHPGGLEAGGISGEMRAILASEQVARQASFMEVVAAGRADDIRARLPYIDVNYADAEGRTALHLAAIHNIPRVYRLLVAEGANAELLDKRGSSVIQLAYESGNIGFARNILGIGGRLSKAEIVTTLLRESKFDIFVAEVLAEPREAFVGLEGIEEGLLDVFLCNQGVVYRALDYPVKLKLAYETAEISRFALTPVASKELESSSESDTESEEDVDVSGLMEVFMECSDVLGEVTGDIRLHLEEMFDAITSKRPLDVQKYRAETDSNQLFRLKKDSRELSRYYSKIRTSLKLYMDILKRMSIPERASVFRALSGHDVFRDGSIYYDVLLGSAVSEVVFKRLLTDGEEHIAPPRVSIAERTGIRDRSLEGIGRAGEIISGKHPLTSTPKGRTVDLEVYYRRVLINYAQILNKEMPQGLQHSAPIIRDLGEALKNCGARIADAAQQTLSIVSGEVKSGALEGRLQMLAQIERNAAFEEAVAIVTNSGAGGINTHDRLIYLRLSVDLGLGIQGAEVAAYRDRAVDELRDGQKMRFMEVFWQQYTLQRVYSGAKKYLLEEVSRSDDLRMQIEARIREEEYDKWLLKPGPGWSWEDHILESMERYGVRITSEMTGVPLEDLVEIADDVDPDDEDYDDVPDDHEMMLDELYEDYLSSAVEAKRSQRRRELVESFTTSEDEEAVRARDEAAARLEAAIEAKKSELAGRPRMVITSALHKLRDSMRIELEERLYKDWLATEEGIDWLARFQREGLFAAVRNVRKSELLAEVLGDIDEDDEDDEEQELSAEQERALMQEKAALRLQTLQERTGVMVQALLQESGLIAHATGKIQVLTPRDLLIQALKTENRDVLRHLFLYGLVARGDVPEPMLTPGARAMLDAVE